MWSGPTEMHSSQTGADVALPQPPVKVIFDTNTLSGVVYRINRPARPIMWPIRRSTRR